MALDLVTQLFVDGAWTTYTSYEGQGWRTRIGPSVEAGLQQNEIEFTLANDDLSMDPSNVESALYGKIGPNTPARLRIDSSTLTWGEARSWEPDRTVEHSPGTGRGLSWVRVASQGLIGRLGRWEDPLDSPMRRQTLSYSSLLGYWPLEDPSGSATLAQVHQGASIGTYTGTVTLAGDDGPGGADTAIVAGSDVRVDGRFATSTASGWQVCWSMKFAAVPGGAGFNVMFAWVDTASRTWSFQANNTTFRVVVSAGDGTVLKTSDSGHTVSTITQWLRYRIKTTVSGSTVTFEPAWYAQDAATPWGWTDTFSSTTTAQPRDWRITGNSYVDGSAYGQVFAVTDTSLDLINSGDARNSFNGYLGERAASRFNRLLGEFGFNRYIGGTSALSAPMGRQRPAKLLDLLEECARTDGALIFDEPLDIALTFRCNNALINKPVALTLTYGTNLSAPLRKTLDDVGVVNDITVVNWDGSQVRLEKSSGPRSTAVPPDGVGRYRKTLDVSLQNPDAMPSRGNWELANGTLARARYQQVVVDLLSNPSLRSTVNALRPGDILELVDVEPDPVLLRVMTIERQGDGVRDTATLSCVPADVYQTGEYDDGVVRYDSGSTTLGSGVSSSATSLSFSTTNRNDCWSTTAEPYDVLIAGERITVTSMGSVSGSGPWTQTATVTRSANGVSKAQSAGAEIHIAYPGRWALGDGG